MPAEWNKEVRNQVRDTTPPSARIHWVQVAVAAVLMLATLPGRTQGLGLITEPLLQDLQLDRVTYANLNLWATLLGAVFCLPTGWVLDRWGLRWPTMMIVLLLGAAVWRMSAHVANVTMLFCLLLGTRALGQSALSVASITLVGKSSGQRVGLAMGVYSVLLSVLFALAFVLVGNVVRQHGWRLAWWQIGIALLLGVAPLVLLGLRTPADGGKPAGPKPERIAADGLPLVVALRTPAFWIFSGAVALFGLVSSGLGLFNEAVLAERGFDQQTFHTFLAVTTLVALLGQLLCGWLSLRWAMQRLLCMAMMLYGLGLAGLPCLQTRPQLWVLAGLVGMAGGFITVIFFAVWSHAFGLAQLGRIQGAAQMLTVFASAIGPLLFAKCHEWSGSYAPILWTLAPGVLLLGMAALYTNFPKLPNSPAAAPP